jgi:hypothetical protein
MSKSDLRLVSVETRLLSSQEASENEHVSKSVKRPLDPSFLTATRYGRHLAGNMHHRVQRKDSLNVRRSSHGLMHCQGRATSTPADNGYLRPQITRQLTRARELKASAIGVISRYKMELHLISERTVFRV